MDAWRAGAGGGWTHTRLPVSAPASSLIRSPLSFQEYIDAHPETIVLDPLPAIRTLLDRSKSYELIRKIEAYMKGTDMCAQHLWHTALLCGYRWPLRGRGRCHVFLSTWHRKH